jgi:hypothetical protein
VSGLARVRRWSPETWSAAGIGTLVVLRLFHSLWYLHRYGWKATLGPDSLHKLVMARSFAEHMSFAPQFANWPAPLFWLDGLLLKVWPNPMLAPACLDALFAAATVFLLHTLALRIGTSRLLAFALAAFWAFQPVLVWVSASYYTETRTSFFILLGIYAWIRHRDGDRRAWAWLSAASFLAASAGRLECASFCATFTLLAALAAWRTRDRTLRLTLAGCAALTWVFAVAYLVYWWRWGNALFITGSIQQQLVSNDAFTTRTSAWILGRIFYHPRAMVAAWHVWVLAALPGFVLLLKRKPERLDVVLFALMPLAALMLASANHMSSGAPGPGPRLQMIHGMLWTLCGFYFLDWLCQRARRPLLAVAAILLLIAISIPTNLRTALATEIASYQYLHEFGDALDGLFASGVLSPSSRVLLLPCDKEVCGQRPQRLRWDQSALWVHHRVTIFPRSARDEPQLQGFAQPDPSLEQVRAADFRVVVVAPDEELSGPRKALFDRLRGALTQVGVVMDYRVFVFSDDAALGRALEPAIKSVSRFTPDRAAFAHQDDGSIEISDARAARSATFFPDQLFSLGEAIYNRRLRGDFTATVRFDALDIPRPSEDHRNELSLDVALGESTFTLKLFRVTDGDCYFFADFLRTNRIENKCGFRDDTGRLRMRRTGARICADYFREGAWHEVGCRDDAAGPALVKLGAYSDNDDPVDARFSEFQLEGE